MSKPKVLVLDLDGCLVDSSLRTEIHTNQETGKVNFETLHEGIMEYDKVNEKVHNLVIDFIVTHPVIKKGQEFYDPIVILTGRNTYATLPTLAWLKNNTVIQNPVDTNFRATNDYSPAHIYKMNRLSLIKKNYDIEYYFDDDISCVFEAIKEGITAIWFPSDIHTDKCKRDVKKYVNENF